ncbi:alpha/beta hydrolase [Sphingobacterium alkalisoli]|uniref:Alpha/beta hydrolase n=1 Tax=Sphingobacterium alkalisoli TaxID=1874115 RepID=A0A4U0GY58_9SPHI|nr:alpha/beta hydrolase [Sphingobacterium alkalisoli]
MVPPRKDEKKHLLTSNYQSPITSHQSLVTNHQLPTTSYQPLVTNHQSPVTNHLTDSDFT